MKKQDTEFYTYEYCKNCNSLFDNLYCSKCGQKKYKRLDFPYIISALANAYLNFESGLFYTSKELLLRPGKTIIAFWNGKRKRYYAPLIYFIFWIAVLIVTNKYFFAPLCDWLSSNFLPIKLDEGISASLEDKRLLLILLGLAIIEYFVIAYPRYSFVEVIIACLFIYGTNYMLIPYITILEIPIFFLLNNESRELRTIITDIPSAILVSYMLMDLLKRMNITYWFIRFLLGVFLGYSYYIFMIKLLTK